MKKLYLLLFCCMCIGIAKAQDANYWSAARNPAGFLTPGSAVAFTRDSGALYFNPALLAYNTKNSATITGSVYQLTGTRIKNGAGAGLNLSSTNVNIVPVMASGVLAIKGKKKFTIGYAIVQNPIIDYQATQQLDSKFNVLDDAYSPGNESFIGQYSAQNIIRETTGLLTTGFMVTNKLAFGLTAEASYRKQHIQESYSARALINTSTIFGLPPITNVEQLYQINHYNINLKFKAGLAYDEDRNHLGLTVSSPLIALKGNGELLSDNLITDLRTTPTDTLNLLSTTRQSKLKETWKMPLSIAAAYAYDIDKGQLYFSAEYFNSVDDYNIITPRNDNFIRVNDVGDDSFTSELLRFKDARKAVLNYGVGFSYLIKPEVTGFFTARTDFSYADNKRYINDDGYVSNTSFYNIYHFQFGGNLKKRKFNLRTGLLLDYGHTSKYIQPLDMTSARESNFLSGDVHNTSASYFSIGLMFAYMHNF